jgi:type IV fimbrial biogenesis protein FimT
VLVRRAGQGGVTLVELMIGIFVLAILATLAMPGFRDAMRRGQVRDAAGALAGSFAYARSEAVTRGIFVSICPSATGDACSGGASYESGWIVYAYPPGTEGAGQAYDKGNGAFVLLRRVDAANGVAVSAADTDVITFGQQGQLMHAPVAGKAPVRLAVCATDRDGRAANTRAVPGVLVELEGGGGSHAGALKAGAPCAPT